MKKYILLCTLAVIIAFSAGWFACLKVNTDSVESFEFKLEYMNALEDALEAAENVMDNNDLWDIDGSDTMMDYMLKKEKADSIIATQL